MRTFKLFNFNLRSSAMVQADGCTTARQKIGVTPRTTSIIGRFASVLCLILIMLLTLGVGEMGADNTIVVGVAGTNASNYTVKVEPTIGDGGTKWGPYALTKAGITFEGKKLYIGTMNEKYGGVDNLDIHYYSGSTWISKKTPYSTWTNSSTFQNRIFNYDATNGAKYSDVSMTNGARVYFDASTWSQTAIKLVTGHANHQKYYALSAITNTKLYYGTNTDTWSDAMGFGIVGGTSRSGSTDQWLTDVSDKAAEYTGWKNYGLTATSTNNAYLVVPAGKAGEQPTINYYETAYNSLNSTQTIKYAVSTHGATPVELTSGIVPANIAISSYKFTNGTYNSVSSSSPNHALTANGSYYNATITAARTATTTLTVSNVAADYTFVGWYTAASGGTELSTNTTYTYYPTSATTVYARFSYEPTHQVTISHYCTTTSTQIESTTQAIGEMTYSAISAPAIEGYRFVNWTVGGGLSTKAGDSNTSNPIHVKSLSSGTYTLTANYATRAGVKMYFAKPTALSWSTARAYAWKSSDDSKRNAAYPGVTLSTTEVINCVTYYVYQYYTEGDGVGGTADDPDGWDRVVFNDNNDSRKTANLTIADGHYYYKNSSGTGKEAAITSAWYIKGTMNSWSESNPITETCNTHTGSVTMNLTKDTQYELKVYNEVNDQMWSNNTALGNVTSSVTATTLYTNDAKSIYMTPSITGAYKFTVTNTNTTPQLAIDYPNQYINGSWNNSDTPFNGDGCVSVDLAAGTYTFKIKFNNETYGCDATISGTVNDYIFYTNVAKPCTLSVATAGTYVFGWNGTNHSASVLYPADNEKAYFTPNTYIYFDISNSSNWKTDNPAAKFWFKNALTGIDIDAPLCLKSAAVDWIYFGQVPDNDYVGRVQMNRTNNDGVHWNHSIIEHAKDRSTKYQNCLVAPSSGWDDINLTWTTYCPPIKAVTLADNSTVKYGSGAGTQANPYLVEKSTAVRVKATNTTYVDDPNMTAKYIFFDGATQKVDQTGSTYSMTANSSANVVHKMVVKPYNTYNSVNSTQTLKSDTLYYKTVTCYSITYNGNGQTAGMVPSSSGNKYMAGTNVTVDNNSGSLGRSGYTFDGWNENSTISGTAHAGGSTISSIAQSYTLYAKYKQTVTLNQNGATTNGSTSATVVFNSSSISAITAPAKTGYTFGGWNTSADGTGYTLIKANGTLNSSQSSYVNSDGRWTSSGDAPTLYAIWTQNITLNQNGATTSGSTSLAATYNKVLDASSITNPSKTGYTFAGWTTGSGGSGTVVINASKVVTASVSNWTDGSKKWIHAGTSTLYAKWTEDTHTVTVSSGGNGTVSPTSVSGVGIATASGTIIATPNTGYHFVNWTIPDGVTIASGSTTSTSITINATADGKTITANFAISNYDITYTAATNGSYTIKAGSGSAVSTNIADVDYNTVITLAATPANVCYELDHWTVTKAGGGTVTVTNNQFNMPDGDVTVAASFVQVNLAYNKTVVAGYEDGNPDEVAAKVTDGSESTAWVTWVDKDEADEWFYVDLGAFYQLNNVEVVWGADCSTDYIIQARQNAPASSAEAADDNSWVTLAEVTDAATNSTKSTSVSAPARYVRLHSLSRSNNCIRVKEFRVFGTATATAYTTPTLSTAEVDNYPSNYEDVVLHLVGTDSKSTAIHTYKITDESSNVSIVTTDGDNLVTISGLSKFEHHTLTVQAMDPGALLSASQNVAVLIWDPTYNMAQGKTIVAGYEPGNPGEHSEYAVDGSTSTGWTTYEYQPESVEWFYVDLGAYYQLSRIELVWGEVYSTDYVLEVRQDVPATSAIAADDNLWFPVAEVKDATASSTKSTAVDVRARYVRFHSLSRSAGFLRLYEFRVFTTRFADADTNVPVITTATASYNDDGKAYLNLTATDVEDGTTKWFYLYNPATSSYSLQQTNGSNQIVIDGLTECENYTFQVQAMDTAAKLSVVSNIAVRVPIISTTNLARGKTATAGTTQGGFVAANAVDGNTGSMWSGNYDRKDNENQWISIDLADKYSIDSIKITWGGNDGTWPQDYELQVSYDGSDYQPIGHYTTKPANQNCKYTFTNVSAQYVRVWAITAGSTYGMEICEIAVHGDCYDDTELPIMLFAEAEEHNVYVSAADIYVGAIHKSIASENLLYHVEYSSTGGDSGSRTITSASITNGVFSLDELRDGDTYTVNIWAAKTSDISSNRSANYRTVSFTTLELGGYTQYYFPGNMNGWLGVNNPARWSPDPVEWRFKTTAINGIYKLSHSVSTTEDWVACFVYDKNNSIRTANDHTISVTKDNDFIITMKGLESYISNSHTIYIAGDAVGTAVDAEDAAHALTWTDGTHASWEGYVTSGETFKLIFHDQGATGNKRTNVLTPSAVTYDGSAQYAKITFDLDTWEYEWSATDVSTYIYDDNSGDGKWSTTSNWLSGALPTIEKDVIITKPVTVDITTARANSVVLDQSGDNTGQLVLDAGKELVVATTVRKTTNGSSYTATGENDIVFNSTSGAGLGALAIGSHATANGLNNATVNFSTLSNGEEDNTASDAQYVGTPFGNHPKMVYQFYNSWMYKFINTGVPGWTRVDGEDGLDAFQGYCIFSADGTGHTYWMQGTLVASEDQTISLRHNGGDGSNANNENMLANSWMAPIQISAFDASDFTNADATIYIYNTGSPDDYRDNNGATSTGTQAGQYSLYTVNTCPTTAIIPSMQAFSVYTHGSTPSISLDYSKIVYDPAVAGSVVPGKNRAPQRTETDEPEKMRLYIGAESGYGDMLYMLEREDFAEGFENGWDGRKMFGEDVAPQLYAITPDGNMAINCIPTFEGQLLGFRKGAQDNTYTFTFEYDGDNMWYLNDIKEQTSTLISAFDSYTFTSEADDTEARFIISRSPIHSTPTAVESATGAQQPAIRKIVINDHVFIIRNGLMYDVTGIMVR